MMGSGMISSGSRSGDCNRAWVRISLQDQTLTYLIARS
jgi:hypothetical protein